MMTTLASRPATEPQINYVRSLIARRDTSAVSDMVRIINQKIDDDKLTHGTVSSAIDALLKLPLKIELAQRDASALERIAVATIQIPEGHYAIGPIDATKFYKVDKPSKGRWAGRTFLSIQASDVCHPIKNHEERRYVFETIAQDPRAAAIRYGKELGRCSICHRTLTDPDSINAGIGPVCARRRGWSA